MLSVTRIRDKCFAVMLLFWCFHDKYFFVNYAFCDMICRFFFGFFLPVKILYFVIVNFEIIFFLLVISGIVVPWFFFPDSLPTVFLDMSRFVAVMKFWYVCTLFMSAVFYHFPVYPSSRAGTLVLGFYVERFSYSLEIFVEKSRRKPWYWKTPHEWGGSHSWHKSKTFYSREITGCIAATKVRLGFVPQWCYSSQKNASPGVQNSTMRISNSRRTFFDSMIRMKYFGSELKAHFFEFF